MASTTTTALVAKAAGGPMEIVEISVGELQPDEALVEMHATGICHTDVSCIEGVFGSRFPAVFGHEGGGIVKEVGANVKNVAKGDKVLCGFAYCGDCFSCNSSHPAYCYNFGARNFGQARADGTTVFKAKDSGEDVHGHFFGQSSFARLSAVHMNNLVKVPQDTKLETFVPLCCGMMTGSGGVLNTLNVQEGSSLAVFGAGAVGISAIAAGKIRKAKTIIAIDLVESRLELAKKLGATHTINGKDTDIVEQINKICAPEGLRFGVDATGVAKVVETMISSLGIRGRGATIGAPAFGTTAGVDITVHILTGREYVGCCEGDAVPQKFIPYLMEEHAKGNFPLEELIKVYDFKDYEQAFADAKSGKVIKPVLRY